MEFFAQIDGQKRIIPLYPSDHDQVGKLKRGVDYRFKIVRPRNVRFHKKFFALLNIGFDNQEKYNNLDHYRAVVVMRAGFYEAIETDKGTIYLPTSISFSSMNQDEFEDVFSKVLDVICEQLNTKPFEIRKQIDDFM